MSAETAQFQALSSVGPRGGTGRRYGLKIQTSHCCNNTSDGILRVDSESAESADKAVNPIPTGLMVKDEDGYRPCGRWPKDGLLTAEETSAACRLPPESIIELAAAGYLPHYRYHDGRFLFRLKHVQSYLRRNLLAEHEGRPFPRSILILREHERTPIESLPDVLLPMAEHVREYTFRFCFVPTCVYFLCKLHEVVYVGQTVDLNIRVAEHFGNGQGKDFDRCFYLPVAKDELLTVESAFLAAIRPCLHRLRHVSPDDAAILARFTAALLPPPPCVPPAQESARQGSSGRGRHA